MPIHLDENPLVFKSFMLLNQGNIWISVLSYVLVNSEVYCLCPNSTCSSLNCYSVLVEILKKIPLDRVSTLRKDFPSIWIFFGESKILSSSLFFAFKGITKVVWESSSFIHASWGSKQVRGNQIAYSLYGRVKLLQIIIVMKYYTCTHIFLQEVITEMIKFWVYLGYLIKKSGESCFLEMCL